MTDTPTLLKVLLKQRHIQGHRAFCREYDRAARKIDPELAGRYPGKAQFYRWLSGSIAGLPYADHCRVLEGMFPKWSAEQLFRPFAGEPDCIPIDNATPAAASTPQNVPRFAEPNHAGLIAAFTSRSDFMDAMPPRKLFDGATSIRLAGLSLNTLCQQYPDSSLISMLENGSKIDCLFLDPDGVFIGQRNEEEGHPSDVLPTLTRLNIAVMKRVTSRLSQNARGNLRLRTYDETIRFNIAVVDEELCVVQPYLPDARGVESPTLVMRKTGSHGLFETFADVFTSIWERSHEVVV